MKALLQAVRSRSALALIDQGIVSAGGFITVVILGRWTDPVQLGIYTLAASVLWLLVGMSEALITRPYAIQINKPAGSRENHAFVSLTLNLLLGSAAGSVLLLAAFAFLLHGKLHDLSLLAVALGVAVPFALLREFARRHALANLAVPRALLLDLLVFGSSLGALAALAMLDVLSAVTAIAAFGGSCALGSAWWLLVIRRQLPFRLQHMRTTMGRSWQLGRWFLCGTIAVQMQSYAVHWLSFAFLGAVTTGIYAACLSIVAFSNPIVFGFINILTPQSVQARHDGGMVGLRRQAVGATLTISVAVGAFCIFVGVAGNFLLGLLFPAPEYQGNGWILFVLALSVFAGSLGVPAGIALASLERARALAAVTIATACMTIALVWLGIVFDGLLGATVGLVAGEAIGSAARWVTFLRATSLGTSLTRPGETSEETPLTSQPGRG